MKKTSLFLFISIIILLTFGLMLLFASSAFIALKQHGDAYYYLKKQIISIVVGIFLLLFTSQVFYRKWLDWALPLYFLAIILLCLIFVQGLGKEAGGARRWLQLGFSFQPSDFAKFATILAVCRIYQDTQSKVWLKGFSALILIIIPSMLINIEPDFGASFHLLVSTCVLLFFTNFPGIILIILSICSAPVIYYNIIQVPWRLSRLRAFLDPWQYRFEEGFQLIASYKSFLAGGWFGEGFGRNLARYNLQARHTDFIFAVAGEDIGFIGLFCLCLLYFFITIYTILLIKDTPDNFARLLALGILILFITQAILNMSVNMGILPTKGINLPLVSYGGSSITLYLAIFGIILNINKHATDNV